MLRHLGRYWIALLTIVSRCNRPFDRRHSFLAVARGRKRGCDRRPVPSVPPAYNVFNLSELAISQFLLSTPGSNSDGIRSAHRDKRVTPEPTFPETRETECLLRVKMRNSHPEWISSASPQNAGIARGRWHFAFVPATDTTFNLIPPSARVIVAPHLSLATSLRSSSSSTPENDEGPLVLLPGAEKCILPLQKFADHEKIGVANVRPIKPVPLAPYRCYFKHGQRA
jgi:hypothetical protein